MKLADIPEVLALSVDEKLQLMDELWQDVGQNLNRQEVSLEQKRLLNERWEAYLQDRGIALGLDDFKLAVKALRR
jgi:putative addiction module component (TIGR02574 family)